MKTVSINKFDGGILNDPRAPVSSGARVVTNFDVLTNAHKMTPYRDSESGDSAAATSQKKNFCIALFLPGSTNSYRLFALGVMSGTGKAEILMKSLSTGASTDLDGDGWSTPGNNQSSSGSTNFELFVYYKKTGLIYGAKGLNRIWAFNPTTGGAWDDDIITTNLGTPFSYTNIAQGLVHSKDDVLYVPYDNKIAKNDNGTWSNTALTLPTEYYITSISEYGNYLAIGCASLSGIGRSRVFLWDRDSSLATLSDTIDWGEERLFVLEEVDGVLIGISLSGSNSTRFSDRVIFRYLSVSSAVKFGELLGGTSTDLKIAKQKVNNRLYFSMSISLNGSTRVGVWSVGRNNQNSPFSIVHERTPNNDTAITNGVLHNFFLIGDFMFISYSTSGGAVALSKTNDTSSYTATSIFESLINQGMPETDRHLDKKLMSVGATYEALPAGAQVVVKYRVNGGAFTTVFTETTDGVTRTEPYTRIAAGTAFTDGAEYEFRIESTGGAEVTGLHYKYDVKTSN